MNKNRLISLIQTGLLTLFCFADSGYSQIYISVQITQAQPLQPDSGAHQTIFIGDSIPLASSSYVSMIDTGKSGWSSSNPLLINNMYPTKTV